MACRLWLRRRAVPLYELLLRPREKQNSARAWRVTMAQHLCLWPKPPQWAPAEAPKLERRHRDRDPSTRARSYFSSIIYHTAERYSISPQHRAHTHHRCHHHHRTTAGTHVHDHFADTPHAAVCAGTVAHSTRHKVRQSTTLAQCTRHERPMSESARGQRDVRAKIGSTLVSTLRSRLTVCGDLVAAHPRTSVSSPKKK